MTAGGCTSRNVGIDGLTFHYVNWVVAVRPS